MPAEPHDTLLNEAEIARLIAGRLPRWRHEDGTIRRTFRTAGWQGTILVVNAVAHLAEAAWHHPDLVVSYAAVEVRLSTHSAGGVTAKDIALAARIEDVIGWQPAREGGPLEGPPAGSYIRYDDGAI